MKPVSSSINRWVSPRFETAAKRDAKRAESVRDEFQKLESVFVASNGSASDLSKSDQGRVGLDVSESVIKRAMSIALAAAPAGPLSPLITVFAGDKMGGQAQLGEDGRVSKLDAQVAGERPSPAISGGLGLGLGLGLLSQTPFTKNLAMETTPHGSKRYEVMYEHGSYQSKTVVMEGKDGQLTLLEDSSRFGMNNDAQKEGSPFV